MKDLGKEWVLFSQGTAVALDPEVPPLSSAEEFAACFHDYPFHRVKFDLYQELAKCFAELQGSAIKEKASKAARRLLETGYPVPGISSDRYLFIPKPTMGLTWVIDDLEALRCYSRRRPTAEELVTTGTPAGCVPWTVDDPQIDARCADILTITELVAARPLRSDQYRYIMNRGIDSRRIDYMLPRVVGSISAEGIVRLL